MNEKARSAKRGGLETGVRVRARRDSIRRGLLGVLVAGGILGVAAAAPKLLGLLRKEHIDTVLPPDANQRIRETASRLKRKELIEFFDEGGRRRMRITAKGREEFLRIVSLSQPAPSPKRWDRRWRIVIFDIPERKRAARDRVRGLVRRLGFLRLQDSVWVYPYDCEEVIALLKADLKIGKEALYLVVDAIEFDRPLREHFKLPPDR